MHTNVNNSLVTYFCEWILIRVFQYLHLKRISYGFWRNQISRTLAFGYNYIETWLDIHVFFAATVLEYSIWCVDYITYCHRPILRQCFVCFTQNYSDQNALDLRTNSDCFPVSLHHPCLPSLCCLRGFVPCHQNRRLHNLMFVGHVLSIIIMWLAPATLWQFVFTKVY